MLIEKPIHVLNIALRIQINRLIQPRNLVVAEENSQVKIISEHIGDE